MLLKRRAPLGDPLQITVKQPGPLFVRVPPWVDAQSIVLQGTEHAPRFGNGYLFFASPQPHQPISIVFPLRHQEIMLSHRTRDIRVRLRGDEVVAMDNFGADLTYFELTNLAEEHQRVRVLREREQTLRELRTVEQGAAHELQEARFSARECAGKLEDIERNQQLAAEQLARIAAERDSRHTEIEASADERSRDALHAALELRNTREAALAACRDALAGAAGELKQIEELRLRTEHESAPVRNRVAELRLAVQAAELAASAA